MKFKLRPNRRHNMYFTLFACGVGIWLMVVRFGLSVEKLISFAIISIFFLIIIVGAAAGVAYLIRLMRDRSE